MTSSARGYVAIVRTPRVPANLLAGVAVRLGCGIIPFSTVVAFADPYGFTYSGLATAGFMLSMSLLGPWRGRMFDRYGSRTLTAGALSYALLITAAALSVGQATPWLPIALLTAAGPVMPPINATLRTRWSRLLPDKQDLQQVHALDSIVEEITFLFSPILITAALSVVPARACIMLGGVNPPAVPRAATPGTPRPCVLAYSHQRRRPPGNRAIAANHLPHPHNSRPGNRGPYRSTRSGRRQPWSASSRR
ncbi:hypothetical protein ACGFZJ_34455 [Streptomyces sp. NPDC048253]|uniref:hypothetical protein n=1 Tax=Streptomyces sp. NPDC048253 TaxID=3365524 RepID=UPI0037230BCA